MAINSRTKNGWGNISGYIGNDLTTPTIPHSLRIVIPGNDIKRVFSVTAGYIVAPDSIAPGILTAGLLVICEGVLDEEGILNPVLPFDSTERNPDSFGLTGFQNNRILFACPVSGVTPFHALFSDSRAIESNEKDSITLILSYCYASNTVAFNAKSTNAFLNAFGVIDVAGEKRDFGQAYEIR